MLVRLRDLLKKAQQEHYAVGLFNTTDTDLLSGVLAAAEKLRAPVIIGTAEVLLPYGPLPLIAPALREAARRASVPVALHYDHGLTFERCMEALSLGFTSVMFDASAKNPESNFRESREIVKIAHAFGADVEGEIGHVGEAATGDNIKDDLYTTVEEALSFIDNTGVDALAVAIGTAHGVYREKPNLNLARLREIRAATDVPLVLHGGSGLSDEDFKNTVRDGIATVNIFTDLCLAADRAAAACVNNGVGFLEARQQKVAAVAAAVEKKIRLFGSAGKAD